MNGGGALRGAAARLRAYVRGAPWVGWVAAGAFVSQFVVLDVVFHGASAWLARPWSQVAAIESVLLWSALLALARPRAARVAIALVAATVLALQAFVFRFFHVPFNVQVAETAIHAWRDVRGVAFGMLPSTLLAIALVGACEIGLLYLALLHVAPRPRPTCALAACALVGVLLGPEPRLATPDVRAAHALGALRPKPPRPIEGAVALPPLYSSRPEIPNVLFVLTESVRALDYVVGGPGATAGASAEVTRGRVDLEQMRSISSYTAISLSAVLTGRVQLGGREDILKAPNLFDFARAAGAHVAYYSGHSKQTFETKDVSGSVDRFVSFETLTGMEEINDDAELAKMPLDRMATERFISELADMRQPSFTMLHFIGTHAPYTFDDAQASFRPFSRVVAWSEMENLRNAYKNAIVEQDRLLARALRAFVDRSAGRPWLVVFTSDHGEAFGEHGAIHHGQSLYDEQVHVPGWIAAGNGALDESMSRALADHGARFVTHLDVVPTILDALGLWDNFAVRPYRDRMGGRSLLRPWVRSAPVPVTNCTGMFPCPLNTWGLFDERHKLVAQAWDAGWICLEIAGEERRAAPGDPACAALEEASRAHFPLLPNGSPNR